MSTPQQPVGIGAIDDVDAAAADEAAAGEPVVDANAFAVFFRKAGMLVFLAALLPLGGALTYLAMAPFERGSYVAWAAIPVWILPPLIFGQAMLTVVERVAQKQKWRRIRFVLACGLWTVAIVPLLTITLHGMARWMDSRSIGYFTVALMPSAAIAILLLPLLLLMLRSRGLTNAHAPLAPTFALWCGTLLALAFLAVMR